MLTTLVIHGKHRAADLATQPPQRALMSTPSPAVRSDGAASTRPSWRQGIIWVLFFAALLAGVALALRFGQSVPVLIDQVH